MTSGSLWNYQRDETDDTNDNASEGKSFEYKTKAIGKTPAQIDADDDGGEENVSSLGVKVTIPLEYLCNF